MFVTNYGLRRNSLLVLEEYDVTRIHGDRLVVGTSAFTREQDQETFLENLRQEGFKLRRKSGDEVTLKALSSEITYSIGGAEMLIVEIDSNLDESSLK